MALLVGTLLWVFVYILGPFFAFCYYPLLKRYETIGSPRFVVPASLAVSGFFVVFYSSVWNGSAFYGYEHFAGAEVLFLVCYYVTGFRLRYTKLDGALLSFLTLLACDQLWQLPYDAVNWTTLLGAEVGLATGGFSWMSLPVLFYFLLKFSGRIRLSAASWFLLGLLATLTAGITFTDVSLSYYLILPWFAFFLTVFAASRPPMTLEDTSKATT